MNDIVQMDKPVNDNSIGLKVLIVGDTAVGKTNLLKRFISDQYIENPNPTLVLDIMNYKTTIKDQAIDVNFWDTAGQEKYRAMTTTFYKDTNGVILVFDITNRYSFVNLDIWLHNIETSTNRDMKVLLIGNKSDLEKKRRITIEEIQAYAKKKNLFYMETSALTNQDNCVNMAFQNLLEEIVTQFKRKRTDSTRYSLLSKKARTSLIDSPVEDIKKKGCC